VPDGPDNASALVGRLRLLITFVGLLPDLITDARIHLLGMLMIYASTATFLTG